MLCCMAKPPTLNTGVNLKQNNELQRAVFGLRQSRRRAVVVVMVAKLQREQRSEAAVSAVLTSRCSSRLGASQKPLCLVNMHLCQHWECRYLPAFWLHDVSEHCVCWTTQLQNILWCFYNRNLWIVCLLESFVARQTNKTTNKIQRTRFTPTHLTIYLSTNLSIYPSIYHPSIRLVFSKHRF